MLWDSRLHFQQTLRQHLAGGFVKYNSPDINTPDIDQLINEARTEAQPPHETNVFDQRGVRSARAEASSSFRAGGRVLIING
jgi:hypothetical protein